MKQWFRFKSLLLALPFLLGAPSCKFPGSEGCACTEEIRFNFCITLNGSDSLPAGVTLVRVRGDIRDTVPVGPTIACLSDWPGTSKVQVFREGAMVKETGYIQVKTVDCCHGEDKKVDITLP